MEPGIGSLRLLTLDARVISPHTDKGALLRKIQGKVASASRPLSYPGQWVINFLSVLALLIIHTSEQLRTALGI